MNFISCFFALNIFAIGKEWVEYAEIAEGDIGDSEVVSTELVMRYVFKTVDIHFSICLQCFENKTGELIFFECCACYILRSFDAIKEMKEPSITGRGFQHAIRQLP